MTTRTTDGLVPRDEFPPSTGSISAPTAAKSASEPLRRMVRVVNPLGLHQRAADRFARAAKRFSATVTVYNGDLKADGKDLWALMTLIVFPDSDVILEVDGADAPIALEQLSEVLGAPSGEDYTI